MREPALALAVETAQALAHPARLRILLMLRSGTMTACQLGAVLGLSRSSVAAHLSDLERVGFIQRRRRGRLVGYLVDRSPATAAWLRIVARSAARDARVSHDAQISRELRSAPPAAPVPCGSRARKQASAPGLEAASP